uniref:Peptidase S8/S53 domain-containing protein n=1 Tax=Tanacetum cinerariifolium TaxID=118510 RepID=A0A6L2K0H2_TANCI|nr:peptidase S8/S53 domain-containing protein [Tanacetum cinerariifolium]
MGYSCISESLKLIDVKGKIVLCDAGFILVGSEMGEAVKEAGGAAMIIANNKPTGNSVAVEIQVLPSSHIGYREGVAIKKYLNSTSAPVATIIQRGMVLGVKSAPQVMIFSSRGPNHASPGILKPDIVGPGVDILAACHESVDNNTRTQATFNIISGTSMSCPHLAGIEALIESTHPDWSPAAIKSATVTTTSNSIELSNDHYVLYDRVVYPLTAQQERNTRKDYGTRRGCSSACPSSAFGQPSSSHLNDDDNDGNNKGTLRASTPSPTRFVNLLTNEVPQIFSNPPNIDPNMEEFYTRQTEILNRQA